MDLKIVKARAIVRENYKVLCDLFPNESFGSPAGLFNTGRNAGVITNEEHRIARDYYGNLWDYAGD